MLKTRGLIDGIGIQGHYFEFRSDLNASSTYVYSISTIKSNLDRIADTGIPVYITEFDIDEPDDADQLAQHKIYFPIFWYHPAVKGITFWGYIEGDVWTSHPNTYLINADNTERPALQWLRNFILSPVPPEPIYPNYDSNVPRNLVLSWHSSVRAASYHVQISTNLQFTDIVVDSTISDTLMQSTILEASKRYSWRVSAVNEYGESDFSNTLGFTTGTEITSLENVKDQPASFTLFQNYPNPFNPETTISFQLPERSFVQLDLFNIAGEEILNITNGQFEAGLHNIKLNVSKLSSGVYFYCLGTKNFREMKKLVLLK